MSRHGPLAYLQDLCVSIDLPRLARELDQWQRAAQQQPVIVMSVRFPVDYPKSVPFVRMIKPRFKWHTGSP